MADKEPVRDSMYAHIPLPYRVVVRASLTKDAAPQRFEQSVIAYSIMEAVYQALMEATGSAPSDMVYVIESIGPDVPGYYKMLVDAVVGVKP